MAGLSYNDITTLVTPAGTLTYNASSGDTPWIDPTASSGLGMGQIRAPIDDKGQADGYILHDFYEEGAHILLAGVLLIRSSSTESGIRTAREALASSMMAKLRSILRATGTLNFGNGSSLTVKCDVGVTFPGAFHKNFVHGLVTSSPIPS